MAGIITFSPKTTLVTVRENFRYTAARLNKHKLTGALRASFMTFGTSLAAAEHEEDELTMVLEESNAAIQFLDRDLDGVVDTVVGVTGNRRGAGLYKELFGNKRVSEFKRPVLNEQFDAMEDWPETLAGRTDPVLVSVVQKLTPLIPQAKEAQSTKKAVQARLVVFRETGTRARLITEFNALRKSCFGELSKLQHAHDLGAGWAESFFLQSSGNNQALTLLELERQIAANAAEAAHLQALHQERLAQEAAVEETARLAAEQVRQMEIASKREQMATLVAELAELENTSDT